MAPHISAIKMGATLDLKAEIYLLHLSCLLIEVKNSSVSLDNMHSCVPCVALIVETIQFLLNLRWIVAQNVHLLTKCKF